ncbi:hypothetical protein [Acidipropionibacterium jensenii]|uniref:hypothetical protein n=1 Tax=Acidipropionibacterium jensenii TaxID=1749 RepID=UPI0026473FA8|nr:hypothetical protein [Acidipropionibacterium jensenii]MDN5964359.1 hypothetical protein [Actinomyces sp.]MDN6592010.1 hypothetical protein [Acidipropionibacterium jensenii]MDN6618034.1 hypothetical protein [Corynebacterium variabile]
MSDYDEKYIPGIKSAKRLDVIWTPWMGDWFVSHSPRNGNSNAEGPWDQWVNLAISILQHPATEVTRPEAHEAVKDLALKDYYDETDRPLTDDDLSVLFGGADQ